MNNNTTLTDTPPDPIPANAFLLQPKKGAERALKVLKNDLKANGCHWHRAAGTWSCPVRAKETIETLLSKKHIDVTLKPFPDDYFFKGERGQEADRVWTQIDILEKKHYAESMALLVDRTVLEREIQTRGFSLEDCDVKMRLEELDVREKAQSLLMEEIMQLRNSARLLETNEEEQVKLPFHVLGHNVQREILIWKDGRLIALPVGRLNTDELRLYIGSDSEWFQEKDAEKALKLQLIDTAHKKGFIDDQAPLKAGVWYLNKRWLIISGKKLPLLKEIGCSILKNLSLKVNWSKLKERHG